jgi:hypothetical protein
MTEAVINEVLAAMDTISRAIYQLPNDQQEPALLMVDQLAFLMGIISADDLKSLTKGFPADVFLQAKNPGNSSRD